jgi:hypothetical protein
VARVALLVAGVAIALIAILVLAVTRTWSSGPVAAPGPPRFVEESAAAGIDHTYDGEFTFFVGGGVAAFDCSDDGKPDLYFAGGSNPAGLYLNQSVVAGEFRFEKVPDPVTDLTAVTGAYPLDFDGDDLADLAVLRLGENVLLRGLGQCRFERANEAWGFDGGNVWTAAFSAKWEGSAALPTFAFGNYLELTELGNLTGACSANELLRPNEAGVAYGPPFELTPGWCSLSILFSDWDRSGRSDLRISNDREYYISGEEQLWRVADGESPRLYTRAEGWNKLQIHGMGIASHDLTGDGLPEVFLTSQGDNKLQTLADGPDQPSYTDIAIRRGTLAYRPYTGDLRPSTAWHAEFQDVNNDGFVDLFIAKGNVEAQTDYAVNDPNNLLIGQADGTFNESAEEAGLVDFARARGAALADFNLDGMLDLVVVNRRQNINLWRSLGSGEAAQPAPMGDWIGVRLQQAGPNRHAIGSWIEVKIGNRTLEREVTIGGGHASGQQGWIHFGLGDSDQVQVRVQWPDGETGPWLKMPTNQFATVERGASEVQIWLPSGN